MEAAPTCFGLQRNHHQEATASAELKLQDWFSVDIDVVHTYSIHIVLLQSYYAAIALTTSERRIYQH